MLTLWGEREVINSAVNHPWGHGCFTALNLGANSKYSHCGHLHNVALAQTVVSMPSR